MKHVEHNRRNLHANGLGGLGPNRKLLWLPADRAETTEPVGETDRSRWRGGAGGVLPVAKGFSGIPVPLSEEGLGQWPAHPPATTAGLAADVGRSLVGGCLSTPFDDSSRSTGICVRRMP